MPSRGDFSSLPRQRKRCVRAGKDRVRAWGPCPQISGLCGVGTGRGGERGLEAPAGDSSTISSHSKKAIYFLMALALSHEAGTLSFKGTESSLLPHPAGSLKSSPEFQDSSLRSGTMEARKGGAWLRSPASIRHPGPRPRPAPETTGQGLSIRGSGDGP